MARPCLAADDPTGCTVGLSADQRSHGYCFKHNHRAMKYGSPYLICVTTKHIISTKPDSWLRRLLNSLRRN